MPEKVKKIPRTASPQFKRKPGIPKCPVHQEDMKYNSERGLWHCVEAPACKLIHRPSLDRRLQPDQFMLGKGKVRLLLHLPCASNEYQGRAFLFSADQVGLDVTEYLDMDGLVEHFTGYVREVRSSGKDYADRVDDVAFKFSGLPIRIEWH